MFVCSVLFCPEQAVSWSERTGSRLVSLCPASFWLHVVLFVFKETGITLVVDSLQLVMCYKMWHLFSLVPSITLFIFRDAEPVSGTVGVRQMDIHPGWDDSLSQVTGSSQCTTFPTGGN